MEHGIVNFLEYELRLATFTTWRWPVKLNKFAFAKAGFHFVNNNTDQVCCSFCGILIQEWLSTDDPMYVHEEKTRFSSRFCIYLQFIRDKRVQAAFDFNFKEKEVFEAYCRVVHLNQSIPDFIAEIRLKPVPSSPTSLNCKVCLFETISQLLIPCKHIASCFFCTYRLDKCPICRQKIKGYLDVYIS